jgi:hypothetical protein
MRRRYGDDAAGIRQDKRQENAKKATGTTAPKRQDSDRKATGSGMTVTRLAMGTSR